MVAPASQWLGGAIIFVSVIVFTTVNIEPLPLRSPMPGWLEEQQQQIRSQNETEKPIRLIVVTTWRSGSTFFGQLLQSAFYNTSYYHYEPFWTLFHKRLGRDKRVSEEDRESKKNLIALMNCDYENSGSGYNRHLSNHKYCPGAVSYLLPKCCKNKKFTGIKGCRLNQSSLSNVCWSQKGPHLTKIVRARLSFFKDFYKLDKFTVKILYLLRDPRAIMSSRLEIDSYITIDELCQDQESDYYAAQEMRRLYPNQFRVVQYEDLTSNPMEVMKGVLKFIDPQRKFVERDTLENYISTHTNSSEKDIKRLYTTYRNSSAKVDQWRYKLNSTMLSKIEKACQASIQLWGY